MVVSVTRGIYQTRHRLKRVTDPTDSNALEEPNTRKITNTISALALMLMSVTSAVGESVSA